MNVYERHGLMNVEFEFVCTDYAILYYVYFICFF